MYLAQHSWPATGILSLHRLSLREFFGWLTCYAYARARAQLYVTLSARFVRCTSEAPVEGAPALHTQSLRRLRLSSFDGRAFSQRCAHARLLAPRFVRAPVRFEPPELSESRKSQQQFSLYAIEKFIATVTSKISSINFSSKFFRAKGPLISPGHCYRGPY